MTPRPLPATYKVDFVAALWIEYDEALDARRAADRRRQAVAPHQPNHPAWIAWHQAELVCRALARRIRRADLILAGLTAAHVTMDERRHAALDRYPREYPRTLLTLDQAHAWSVLTTPLLAKLFTLATYEQALVTLGFQPAEHSADEHCTVDGNECVICGVWSCSGCGFHRAACPDSDEAASAA